MKEYEAEETDFLTCLLMNGPPGRQDGYIGTRKGWFDIYRWYHMTWPDHPWHKRADFYRSYKDWWKKREEECRHGSRI